MYLSNSKVMTLVEVMWLYASTSSADLLHSNLYCTVI